MAKAAEAFRTISEVAEELDLHKHVLRFWEVKFPQIKPMKRGGGRRYYRPADMELLRGIRHLLHAEGYTIKGVQKILRERGIDAVKRVGAELTSNVKTTVPATAAPEREGRAAAAEQALPRSQDVEERASKAAQPARVIEAAAGIGRTSEEPALGGRSEEIVKAIAELQECRSILMAAPSAQSGAPVVSKPKRAAGARS